MNRKDNNPKSNKPLREDDHIEKNDLPYDPNITKDDLRALDERGNTRTSNEERFLAERERPVDFTNEDMDIPGSDEADTTHSGTDLPDEENFQYDESGKKKPFNEDQIPDEEA